MFRSRNIARSRRTPIAYTADFLGILLKFSTAPPAAPVELQGVLRLRSLFASRRSCCAQDDSCYTFLITRMRTLILLVIVISMSTLTLPQNLPAPQAITDPKLITSKPNANVEQNQQSLSIERLYMTRLGWRHNLVARRQDHRLRHQHQRPQ